MDRRVLLGQIGRPHGVRGLVRVVSYTADPASLATYGPLVDDKGQRYTLRWRGEGLAEIALHRDEQTVAISDRTAAGRLANTRLYIERERLPAPAPDEFYLTDLIGLSAYETSGTRLGRVAAVHDYGAGASLEIALERASPMLVPFTKAAVPEVDLQAERIVVVPPGEVALGTDAAA